MKKIGFDNFRRFEKFPLMELAPITFFVGENNAGKSSVVKGIIAYSDFLNNNKCIDESIILEKDKEGESLDIINKKLLKEVKFFFNTSYLAHIGTFKRAVCNKTKSNIISFHTDLGYIKVSVSIKGNRNDEESISGNVSLVTVNLPVFNIDLNFDVENDIATITFNHDIVDNKFHSSTQVKERQEIYLNSFDRDLTLTTSISANWNAIRGSLISSIISMFEDTINSTIFSENEDVLYGRVQPFLNISKEEKRILKNIINCISPSVISRKMRGGFKFYPILNGYYSKFVNIEYIYAHAVSQTVIYGTRDSNDYLSRTIHEFAPHQKEKRKRDFILKWMKIFGIGTDYVIKSVGGEAHIVYIKNNDGHEVNLADKGMGSIQLMVLLFRLAITLPQKGLKNFYHYGEKVVIIEEPEQNLHPSLQSKLADLFYEINRDYKFRFIVETHSEYLVRRSQVIVASAYKNAEKNAKGWDNPFKVYYFPAEGYPYDMEYATDGYFENPFGKGFFNVSSELSLDLDRIEQGTYNEGQD